MAHSFDEMVAGDWDLDDEDWNPTPAGHLHDALSVMEQASRDAARASAHRILAVGHAVDAGRQAPETYIGPAHLGSRDGDEMLERAIATDVAIRLSLSVTAVRALAHQADILEHRLPLVLAAMVRGEIDEYKARIITDTAVGLPIDDCGPFDAALAPIAGAFTPAKLRLKARVERDAAEGATRQERHDRAKAGRSFSCEDDFDGMAWLHLHTPALDAHQAMARVNQMARRIADHPDETRTLEQVRADVAVDLFTGRGTPSAVGIDVAVAIPVATLTHPGQGTTPTPDSGPDSGSGSGTDGGSDSGTDGGSGRDRPAMLEGYGPIDDATAKAVFANAPSFRRILTDPFTGFARDMDNTTYRPTAAQRAWLRRTYITCAAPGCTRPARDCDIDHTTPAAQQGPTNIPNLAPLCRSIHRLKHSSLFRVERNNHGTITLITPTGYRKDTDPPPF